MLYCSCTRHFCACTKPNLLLPAMALSVSRRKRTDFLDIPPTIPQYNHNCITVVISVLYKTYSDPIGFTPVDIHRILRLSVRRSLTREQRANLSGGGGECPNFLYFPKRYIRAWTEYLLVHKPYWTEIAGRARLFLQYRTKLHLKLPPLHPLCYH